MAQYTWKRLLLTDAEDYENLHLLCVAISAHPYLHQAYEASLVYLK